MKQIIRFWTAFFMTLFALGSSVTASSYTIDTASSPSVLTGLWWNSTESGWGLTITQQYGVIFVAMYTYDAANNPIWYVITNCPVVAGGCTGDIFKVRGGSPLTANWAPNLGLTKVGSGTLAFSDANTAAMNFVIDGVNGSKAITRQVFATAPVQPGGAFPFSFKGIQLNSMTFATNPALGGFCEATLSSTNMNAAPVGALLRFDIIIGGVTRGSVAYSFLGLAPNATAVGTQTVVTSIFPACGTFTLQFNAAASQLF